MQWRWTRQDALWLGGQAVVFVLAFVVVPALDGGPGRIDLGGWTGPAGYTIAALGIAVALWAMVTLGRQLVPQPTPVEGGRLVTSGPYRIVRHPIYLGVLLAVAGSALRSPSLTGAVVTIASAVFLVAKATHEESLLRDVHGAAVDEFAATTRWRVIPGVA